MTITVDRANLETVMMGAAILDQQIEAGKAKLDGNRYKVGKHFELSIADGYLSFSQCTEAIQREDELGTRCRHLCRLKFDPESPAFPRIPSQPLFRPEPLN